MLKKIVSMLIVITLTAGFIPVFGANDTTIFINEVFDDYETNGAARAVSVTGMDGRVVERKGTNKALYVKSWGTRANMNAPISNVADVTVFSVDVMLEGAYAGAEILKFKSSSGEIPLFVFGIDGRIKAEDGRVIGAYVPGIWQNITVAINFKTREYDLYVDGEKVLKKWYFRNTITKPSELIFSLTPNVEGDPTELLIDNLRVYSGDKVLGDEAFPYKAPNTKVVDFEETIEKPPVGDNVFINSNGKSGIGVSMVPKADVSVEWAKKDDEEGDFIHFKRTAGTLDGYVDITAPSEFEGIENYILELDVYPALLGGGTLNLGRAIDKDNQVSNLITLNSSGALVANGVTVGTLPQEEWTTISLVCNIGGGHYGVYLNGELRRAGISLHNGGVYAIKFRLGVNSGSEGEMEFYVGKVKLYEGDEPRELSAPEGNGGEAVSTDNKFPSIMETEEQAVGLIGRDIIFMTNGDSFFIEDAKELYSEEGLFPYVENGVTMMPSELVARAFGTSVQQSGNTVTVGGVVTLTLGDTVMNARGQNFTLPLAPAVRDGVLYLPLRSVAVDGLNKHIYWDDRGFVMFSDKEITHQNLKYADIAYQKEPIDIIYRYMYFPRPGGEEVARKVKELSAANGRPRILATAEDIERVKNNIENDDVTWKMFQSTLQIADGIVGSALVEYTIPDGLRLFGSCINTRDRIIPLAVAYQLTGDTKYAQQCWLEMENACNWKDWNVTRHFLDSGKLGPGIAIGYDMIYDYMTPEQRKFIRDKTREHYLDFCVGAYAGNYSGSSFSQSTSNWAAVCSGSILMVSLAFCDEDEDPELVEICKFLIGQTMQSLEFPTNLLDPDGSWFEGLGYWTYIIEYLSWSAGALVNSCGDDYGFLGLPGLKNTPDFGLYMQTPAKGPFNFAAQNESSSYMMPTQAYQLAHLTDNRDLTGLVYTIRNIYNIKDEATDVLWYAPGTTDKEIDYPLDKYFSGADIGSMRTSWTNKNSTYIGITGGQNIPATTGNAGSHFHRGAFLFDSMGERWSVDLGYTLVERESGAYYGRGGWDIYGRRAEGHNTLVINPDESPGQEPLARTTIVENEYKPRGAYMVIDLHDGYRESTSSMKRGFYFGDDRNTLTIRDEIELLEQSEVYWFMHTRADIEIDPDGQGATLTLNGKQVRAEVLCDAPEWKLEVRDPVPFETSPVRPQGQVDHAAAGITKLTIAAQGAGAMNITVKLIPVIEDEEFTGVSDTPISQWSVPDGELKNKIGINGIISGNSYNADEDLLFHADIPSGFLQARVFVGDTQVRTIEPSEQNTRGEYSISIPPSQIGRGVAQIKVEADYGSYVAESRVTVIMQSFAQTKSLYFSDFSQYTPDLMTDSAVLAALGLNYLATKSGYMTISPVTGLGGKAADDVAFKATLNDVRSSDGGYIEKSFSALSGIVDISFDVYPETVHNRLTISFRDRLGNGSTPASINILNNSGRIGNSSALYDSQTWYKVHMRIDMDGGGYTIKVNTKDGELVGILGGGISVDGLGMARLTFSSPVAAGGYIALDNLKITNSYYSDFEIFTPKFSFSDDMVAVVADTLNRSDENISAYIILKLEDENGILSGLQFNPISIGTGNGMICAYMEIPKNNGPYTVKAMFLDLTKTLIPIAKPATANVP